MVLLTQLSRHQVKPKSDPLVGLFGLFCPSSVVSPIRGVGSPGRVDPAGPSPWTARPPRGSHPTCLP